MLQTIRQWRVTLDFELSEKSITLLIDDNYYSNMLAKLQNIRWDVEPIRIIIEVQK